MRYFIDYLSPVQTTCEPAEVLAVQAPRSAKSPARRRHLGGQQRPTGRLRRGVSSAPCCQAGGRARLSSRHAWRSTCTAARYTRLTGLPGRWRLEAGQRRDGDYNPPRRVHTTLRDRMPPPDTTPLPDDPSPGKRRRRSSRPSHHWVHYHRTYVLQDTDAESHLAAPQSYQRLAEQSMVRPPARRGAGVPRDSEDAARGERGVRRDSA
ncbi:hypothetical protein HYPSUDRAFT_550345 [Hypholoma sublateritium FD-334 SS-4]|uniref:Uncharacterized protein n=1 Tax=Hypholoma sublateritium (strain FD-334 SS-4) TaxID=945553 RepID=A0A0D2P5T2_HYPSF|nr:hypothetical protein HYPSUDRAFT_550345 [Hypholoma sublateritium FD-334 SS-4]